MYLELRRKVWYALHDIPADAQDSLGRRRFCASLKTSDRRTAERRAVHLEAKWRGEIEKARRGGSKDPLEADAAFWRDALADAKREGDDTAVDLILDRVQEEAEARQMVATRRNGTPLDNHTLPDDPDASRFLALATGKLMKLTEHLEAWLASVDNTAKTIDEKRSWVTRFAARHPYVQDVTRKLVQAWANSLAQEEGHRRDTINKALSSIRGYWKYLISLEVAHEDHLPFDRITIPKTNGKGKPDAPREEFDPADVVRLLTEAKARGLDQLADLIQLGMWTGARIEELCVLKGADVHDGWFQVRDAKTKAGDRKVPIHSKLKPVVSRLMKASKAAGDAYLMAGLPANKYDDRSPGIGKAFGRLKTALGFGSEHVFHSIRRTVVTQLENAAPELEGVVADIVGHEKQTITFGLYSGGSSMELKCKVIEKLAYPAPRKSKK